MTDPLEAVDKVIALLERIADAVEAALGLDHVQGECELCGLEVLDSQNKLPGLANPANIRHATAADCLALQ